MLKKIETENYEYHPKLAILRILTLILIIIFFYSTYNNFFNDKKENITLNETNTIIFIQSNSRGDFYSLNKTIFVEGKLEITANEGFRNLKVTNFKITNNKNIKLYLSTTNTGKEMIFIQKLTSNIGDFNFEIPDNIDLKKHKYLIFWDSNLQKTLAYAKLKID